MQAEVQLDIEATPEQLFAMVVDVTRTGEWSPECYRCEWLDGSDRAQVGTRFRGYNRAGRLKWSRLVEVVVADQGHEFAFITMPDRINRDQSFWRYRFEPRNGGTSVTESVLVLETPGLLVRWLGKVGGRPWDLDMRPGMEATLARIKAIAERSHHVSDAPVERGEPVSVVPRNVENGREGSNAKIRDSPKAQNWGWGILTVISVLLVLNGMGWFFTGPGMSLSSIEHNTGVPLDEFRQAYPDVTDSISTNARQVAIWFMAFGTLALLVGLEGYRRRSRWAWNAAWLLVLAPAAIGINVVAGGEFGYGAGMLAVAATALAGQVLARNGLVP